MDGNALSKRKLLHRAAAYGAIDCWQVLLTYGKVPADIKDDYLCTPLHSACSMGPIDVSKRKAYDKKQLAVVQLLI